MISLLFFSVWFGCETTDKTGTPNPIDVPLEIDSVTVIPSQGIRSDSYLQCVPSIRGADYDTLEIRYIWYNETAQTEIGGNYDLTLSSEMVDIDDEIRCIVQATDASGEVAEAYDPVVVDQVLFPLTSALSIFDGERTGDRLGTGLAYLGDADGDGIDDFALGSGMHSDSYVQAGKVYLMKSYEDTMDAPARSFLGSGAKSFLGMHIASAGYIDSDPRPDLLLGATGSNLGGVDSGAVYLLTFEDYWYTGSAQVDLDNSTRIFVGEDAGDKLGSVLLGPGDLDGDGLGDVVLGSPEHSSVGYRLGRVYVHLSNREEPLLLDGMTSSGLFGTQVVSVGDLDGDGIPELWISAPGGSSQRSAVYMFSGGSFYDGIATIDDAQVVIEAEEYGTDFGVMLSSGDLDGDGLLDLLIGAPFDNTTGYQAGALYVYYASSYRYATQLSDSDADVTLYGENAEHMLGTAATALDDLDGDGGQELLVAAPGFSGKYTRSGKIYYMPSSEVMLPDFSLDSARRSFTGEFDHDEAGSFLQSIGDLDGDGLGEFLIAAPMANGSSSDSGRVYVMSSSLFSE
ncbi:MAG: hypothetical protein CL916_15305 [Deltaproteobacteria bacterium]|nr:hypothetical protein [Deltaproteobacteria bacterium]